MEERPETTQRRDWPWLLALFVAVLALRLWHLSHAEITARDSIAFIRIALDFDTKSYSEVLCNHDQHPGYAYFVWLASKPMRAIMGRLDPVVMQYSTQAVSLLASLALIWPTFYLGKLARNRLMGAGAVLFFQFLPTPGHYLSDGVSDGIFLFWIASGLYFALHGFEVGRRFDFPLAGIFCGIAYWTRPEAVILLIAILMCLCGFQLFSAWRRPWKQWGRELAGLTTCALLAGSIYFGATWKFTSKHSLNQTLQEHFHLEHSFEDKLLLEPTTSMLPPMCAMTFAPQWDKSFAGLGYEVARGFHIGGLLPAFIGLCCWRALRSPRFTLLFATYFCGQSAALLLLGKSVGYISERHVMVLVYLGSFSVALGLEMMVRWVLSWRDAWAGASERVVATASLVLICGLIATGIQRTLQPLHLVRVGNHQAGLWLRERLQPGDEIVDIYNWSKFYAGFDFLPKNPPPTGVRYVVVARAKDKPPEVEGQTPVFTWPKDAAAEQAKVTIWKLPASAPRPPALVPGQPVNRPKADEPAEKGRT